jgi:hypothetical protein
MHLLGQSIPFKEVELPEELEIKKFGQDKYGFLWIGSNAGLTIYNGYEFTQLPYFKNKSISALKFSYYNVFIGTKSGDFYIIDFDNKDSIILHKNLGNEITDIEAVNNLIVISTYGSGLFTYSKGMVTPIRDFVSDDVYDLEPIDKSKFAAASDNGIEIVDTDNDFKTEMIKNLPDNIIVGLCRSLDKLYAISYNKSFFSVDLYNRSIKVIDENKQRSRYLKIVNNGRRVVVQTSEKIEEWKGDRSTIIYKNIEKKISSIFIDQENYLWLAKGKNTLLKANLFLYPFKPKIKDEMQCLAYQNGLFYIGTSKGVHIRNKVEGKTTKLLLPNENITVTKIKDNELWIGTLSNGLYIYDLIGGKMVCYGNLQQIKDNTVLDIAFVDDYEIEIATLAGVKSIKLDKSNAKSNTVHDVLNAYVYDIFIDSKKVKWYGKDRNGLSKLVNGEMEEIKSIINIDDKKTYKLGSIYSIAEYNNVLYFASSLSGLLQLKEGKWKVINNTSKINDPITSLAIVDSSLQLIRSSRIDVCDLQSMHILSYDLEAKSNENALFLNNYCIADDDIYFGLEKKINRFTLGLKTKKKPNIYLEKIEVNLDKVKDRINEFSHNENNLRFTFTAGWLTDPKSILYAYQLEGFDQEWRYTNDRIVSYPRLLYGDYLFKVKASVNGVFLDKDMASFQFKIKKAFYTEFWFYALMVSLGSYLIYLFLDRRKKSQLLIAELEKTRIETELINLKSQLDPHFLFNTFNTLIGLIEEDPKRGVKFTESLTNFFRNISEFSKKELITVEQEISLVASYQDILKERFGKNLNLTIDDNIAHLYDTFIPPMSIQMLIENAVKHNEVSRLNPLQIHIFQNGLSIIVKNEIRLKKSGNDPSLKIGNNNIVERYRLLNQEVPFVENTDNFYSFYLPIIKFQKS